MKKRMITMLWAGIVIALFLNSCSKKIDESLGHSYENKMNAIDEMAAEEENISASQQESDRVESSSKEKNKTGTSLANTNKTGTSKNQQNKTLASVIPPETLKNIKKQMEQVAPPLGEGSGIDISVKGNELLFSYTLGKGVNLTAEDLKSPLNGLEKTFVKMANQLSTETKIPEVVITSKFLSHDKKQITTRSFKNNNS